MNHLNNLPESITKAIHYNEQDSTQKQRTKENNIKLDKMVGIGL